jgi:hypothetical protein
MKRIIFGLMLFLFFDLWAIAHFGKKSVEGLLVFLVMFFIVLLAFCFLEIRRQKKLIPPATPK